MSEQMQEPKEDDSIDCHLQNVGMGTLLCRAAQQKGNGSTNEVNPTICFNCAAGRIYREVGCDAVLPKVRIYPYSGGSHFQIESLFCRIRKRETTIEYCKTCPLVTAATTRKLITEARGLFQSQDYYSAYQNIEKAREAIRDGKFDHAITQSISCVESVLKTTLEKMNVQLPSSKGVTDLWKSFRLTAKLENEQGLDAVVQLLNTLSGVVSQMGAIRNSMSDAHGKGLSRPVVHEYIAELTVNTACTLSTAVIRIYRSKGEPPHE